MHFYSSRIWNDLTLIADIEVITEFFIRTQLHTHTYIYKYTHTYIYK